MTGLNELLPNLPVKRILVATYVLCSALAALGAIMMTARTGSGEPNLGGSLSLQAIAGAVVGGTSLAGGRGGVGTAVLGALFVTIPSGPKGNRRWRHQLGRARIAARRC